MAEKRSSVVSDVELRGGPVPGGARVLTPDALALVAHLARRFTDARNQLLERRRERQRRFDLGELPGFLP